MNNPRLNLTGLLLALLVALAAAGLAGLGFWQLDRLAQRRQEVAETTARLAQPPVSLNQSPAASLPDYQPVQMTGEFDFSNEILLRNRSHLGAPGVHVLTPLRLAGSQQAVLVDRGWLPNSESMPEARAAFQQPAGQVTVEGIVRPSQRRPYEFLPGDPTLSPEQPRLDAWFWVDLDQVQAQMPYPLLPFYVEAAPNAVAGQLPVAGYTIDMDEGSHLGYAIQWFSFAIILVVGSWAVWRQKRRQVPDVT